MPDINHFKYYSNAEDKLVIDSGEEYVLDSIDDYIGDTLPERRPNNAIDDWIIGDLWQATENGITTIYRWTGDLWEEVYGSFDITSGENSVDWIASMQQTFEFYTVDPSTWTDAERLDTIKSGSITRDADSDTLGNSRFVITDDIGECYVRVYLIVIQNRVTSKIPLGTFLCQVPGSSFNGSVEEHSVEAYTPLIELKEKNPPFGYYLLKGRNIIDAANTIVWDCLRAPIVRGSDTSTLPEDFIANIDDTWLSFFKDLLACGKYEFGLDEMSRVLFQPKADLLSMQPIWTYDDSNSSILYPDISIERDLYNVPNVVEVIYSTDEKSMTARIVNDDPDSPISTVNRGREVVYRESNPDLSGNVTNAMLQSYGRNILREKSALEYKLTYTHGYCPVRIGDCVMLNYQRAGIAGVKAVVKKQTIRLEPGCPVEETAVYTTSLLSDSWG